MTAASLARRACRRNAAQIRCLRRELAAARAHLAGLRYRAVHDPLTGLLNRDGLAALWPGAGPLLALVDLDRFKPVNDRYGHAAGDQVLMAVAARLRAHATVAARLGGDEFAALLPDSAAAYGLAEVIAEPVTLACGAAVAVTASIGVTHASGLLPVALAEADAAMYRAKVSGAGVAMFDPRADDRASLTADPRPVSRVRDQPDATTVHIDLGVAA